MRMRIQCPPRALPRLESWIYSTEHFGYIPYRLGSHTLTYTKLFVKFNDITESVTPLEFYSSLVNQTVFPS